MTKKMISGIEALATTIAKDASKAEKLSEKIDALRVLTPFYTLLRKKTEEQNGEEVTMADLKAQMDEAEHGGQGEIQHRRGRRADA